MKKIQKMVLTTILFQDPLAYLKQALECEAYKRRVYSVPSLGGWKETLND